MTDARRGEIWLFDFGEPLGHEQGFTRPALVVSSNQWNRHAKIVVVLPITTTRHGLPSRVEIEPTAVNGLREVSYARCEDIRSVSEKRMRHRMGELDLGTMRAVDRVLRMFLDIVS